MRQHLPFPIRLTTAQLHFLLSFLHHEESVPGTETRALFPSDPAAREALWQKGATEAEAAGWFRPARGPQGAWIDEQLMLIGACLVDPQAALMSTIEGAGEGRQGVTHFIGTGTVVEMALLPDGRYELRELASTSVLVGRLATTFGLPPSESREARFTLPRAAIAAAKRDPSPELLESYGLAPEAAEWFANSLAWPERHGTIIVLQMSGGKGADMRLIGVVVGADGSGWLGVPAPTESIRYELADRQRLERLLDGHIEHFRGPLPVEGTA